MYIKASSPAKNILKEFVKSLCSPTNKNEEWLLEYPNTFDEIDNTKDAIISTSFPLITVNTEIFNTQNFLEEEQYYTLEIPDCEKIIDIKIKKFIFYRQFNKRKLKQLEYFVDNNKIYFAKYDYFRQQDLSITYHKINKTNLKWYIHFFTSIDIDPSNEINNIYCLAWQFSKYYDNEKHKLYSYKENIETYYTYWHSLNNYNDDNKYISKDFNENSFLTYEISFDKKSIIFTIGELQQENRINGFNYIGQIDYADQYIGNQDNFGSVGNSLLNRNKLMEKKQVRVFSGNYISKQVPQDQKVQIIFPPYARTTNTYSYVSTVENFVSYYPAANMYYIVPNARFYLRIFSPDGKIVYKIYFNSKTAYNSWYSNRTYYLRGVSLYPSSISKYTNDINVSIKYNLPTNEHIPSSLQEIEITIYPTLTTKQGSYMIYIGLEKPFLREDNELEEYLIKGIYNNVYNFFNIKYDVTNNDENYYTYSIRNKSIIPTGFKNTKDEGGVNPEDAITHNNLFYDLNDINNTMPYKSYSEIDDTDIYIRPSFIIDFYNKKHTVGTQLYYSSRSGNYPKSKDNYSITEQKDPIYITTQEFHIKDIPINKNITPIFNINNNQCAIGTYSLYEFSKKGQLTSNSTYINAIPLSKVRIQNKKGIVLGTLRRCRSTTDIKAYEGKVYNLEEEEYILMKRLNSIDLFSNSISNNINQEVAILKD